MATTTVWMAMISKEGRKKWKIQFLNGKNQVQKLYPLMGSKMKINDCKQIWQETMSEWSKIVAILIPIKSHTCI